MIKCYLVLSCYTLHNCEKRMWSVGMPWESVVYFHIEDPAHKLQNTLEHLLACSVIAVQGRVLTFATFTLANVRFYGRK